MALLLVHIIPFIVTMKFGPGKSGIAAKRKLHKRRWTPINLHAPGVDEKIIIDFSYIAEKSAMTGFFLSVEIIMKFLL
jgi:hypothetical protein